MNYDSMTLEQLKTDLILDAKKGYPFFVAGALYWFVMGALGLFIHSEEQTALAYVIGTGSIFPLAIAIGRMAKVNLLSKNPLGVLGGIIGGVQAFYLPVWIVIYAEQYELIPMAIGVLGASHFLPYLWIYKSKTYLVLTVSMAALSIVFGYVFIDLAFSVLPYSLCALYVITAVLLTAEAKTFAAADNFN